MRDLHLPRPSSLMQQLLRETQTFRINSQKLTPTVGPETLEQGTSLTCPVNVLFHGQYSIIWLLI